MERIKRKAGSKVRRSLGLAFALATWLCFVAPVSGDGGTHVTLDSVTYSGRLQPGEYTAVVVRQSGQVELYALASTPALTQEAQQAVQLAPAWLRSRLTHRFGWYDDEVQDRLARLITQAADPLHIDEIAFAMATVPPEDVLREEFDPSILALNAALIYEAADLFGYVELVEVGTPGSDEDYHTTARYAVPDGAGGTRWIELPREIYYWYVAHPNLGGQPLLFVDPVTGEPAPRTEGGVFWRDYFLYQDVEPGSRASVHFVTEHPHLITDQTLAQWAPTARTFLTGFAVDPVPVVVESDSGRIVLVEGNYPGQLYDGSLLATTLPVETAYEQGHPELLENMLLAGNGNAHLPAGSRVLVIKDRDPWGTPTVENALTGLGLVVDTCNASDLPLMDLSLYLKTVVPSAQPLAFYQQLVAQRQIIEDFLSRNPESRDVVFQFHGATDDATPADRWDGMVMPGGFTCAEPSDGPMNQFSVAGFPKLPDVMAGAVFLWDGLPQVLEGNLPLPQDAQAVIRSGYFGAQNGPDRCVEMPSYYHGPDGQDDCFPSCESLVQALRSLYPQRSLYLHYGNCGEMQQLLGAASRATLMPVADVNAHVDDHVWNELYHEGRWVNYSIIRADAGIDIDSQALTDAMWTAVMSVRGDGFVLNASPRYPPTFTLSMDVVDATGAPVDGATLLLASEYLFEVQGERPLVPLMLAWTDRHGHASVELGTGVNYYVQVRSALGVLPELGRVDKILCEIEEPDCPATDQEGQTLHVTVAYEEQLPIPPTASAVQPIGEPDQSGRTVTVQVASDQEILETQNPLLDWTFEKHLGPGVVDVTVLDAAGMEDYVASRPYVALAEYLDVDSSEVEIPFDPEPRDLFVVVGNRRRAGMSQRMELTVSLIGPADQPQADGPGGGCGCSMDRRPGSAGSVLFTETFPLLILLFLAAGSLRLARRLRKKRNNR